MGTSPKPLPTMTRVLFLAVLVHVSLGAPLEGFGDATDAEIAEIRAGTYLEMFDENPTYNYNYKVADDTEQTYLSLEEARNDGVVTGMYSYVDPLGSLITVKYTAGAMGYTEERSEEPRFVSINPRPVSSSSSSGSSGTLVADPVGSVGGGSAFSSSGSSALSSSTSLSSGSSSLFSGSSSLSSGSSSQSSGTSSSSLDQSSLVSQIISQIQPLVSQTVSSAVAGQSSNAGQSSTSSLTSGQSSTSVSSDQDSLLILRPGSSSSSSSSSSDLVAQILAQIGPLVSQTVSSVVSSGSQTSTIPRAITTTESPTVTVSAIPLRSVPVPTASPRLIASGSQDKESLFGSSGDAFNVKINHAGANIEY